MNPTDTIVRQAYAALRLFGDDLTREQAARLLDMYSPLVDMRRRSVEAADEVAFLVLARFAPAEPPSVAGLDFLAVEADAKTIVAESVAALDEPQPSRVIDCQGDEWRMEPDGRWRVYTNGEAEPITRGTLADVADDYGPLVEVKP